MNLPEKPKKVAKYPIEKKLAGLALEKIGLSCGKIASELDVGRSTVHDWVNQARDNTRYKELSEHYNKNMADMLTIKAGRTLESVDDAVINDASLYQRGVFIDVMLRNADKLNQSTGETRERTMETVVDVRSRSETIKCKVDSVTDDIQYLQ